MSSRVAGRTATSAGCVAFDLGATAVRVVEVEWGKGSDPLVGARVVRRGSAPLPLGVWNDLETHRDAITGAVQQALSSAGITTRSVVACLPRRLVTVRYLRLPPAAPEQMQSMVAFEAQQYVLFPVDEVVLDHHVMTGAGGKGPLDQEDLETVLLAAARRSVITSVMSIFDRAGLELVQLSVSALALAELARDSIAPTALIDMEPGEIDVAVVADGQLLFTRASAIDTTAAQDGTAQRRKVEEVFRSFTAYQNEFRNRHLAHVYYGGPDLATGASADLDRALSEMIDVPVQAYTGPLVPAGDPDLRAYLTAIGTALQTRSGSIAAINLVPRERAELRAQRVRGRQQQVALALAVVLLLLGIVGVQKWLTTRSREQQAQRIANDNLDSFNDRLKQRQKAFDARDGLYKDLTKELDKAHPSVDVLAALNAGLPQSANIWITQFSFERGKALTIRGEAKSASAPVDLALALQRSPAFRNVSLSYIGDAQDSEYDTTQSSGDTATSAGSAQSGASQPTLVAVSSRQAAPGAPGTTTTNPGPAAQGPPGGAAPGLPGPGTPGQPAPGPGGPAGGPANAAVPGGPPAGGRGPNGPANPGGPVPSISPPPGGIQPSTPAASASGTKATAPRTKNARASRATLTSFVITCQVNTRARTLLPASAPAASTSGSESDKGAKTSAKSTTLDSDTSDTDNGGDNADTQ